MASISGRSVGIGSEVGELADIATEDSLQPSGALSFCASFKNFMQHLFVSTAVCQFFLNKYMVMYIFMMEPYCLYLLHPWVNVFKHVSQ